MRKPGHFHGFLPFHTAHGLKVGKGHAQIMGTFATSHGSHGSHGSESHHPTPNPTLLSASACPSNATHAEVKPRKVTLLHE
jgi:hypothetical protein